MSKDLATFYIVTPTLNAEEYVDDAISQR